MSESNYTNPSIRTIYAYDLCTRAAKQFDIRTIRPSWTTKTVGRNAHHVDQLQKIQRSFAMYMQYN